MKPSRICSVWISFRYNYPILKERSSVDTYAAWNFRLLLIWSSWEWRGTSIWMSKQPKSSWTVAKWLCIPKACLGVLSSNIVTNRDPLGKLSSWTTDSVGICCGIPLMFLLVCRVLDDGNLTPAEEAPGVAVLRFSIPDSLLTPLTVYGFGGIPLVALKFALYYCRLAMAPRAGALLRRGGL